MSPYINLKEESVAKAKKSKKNDNPFNLKDTESAIVFDADGKISMSIAVDDKGRAASDGAGMCYMVATVLSDPNMVDKLVEYFNNMVDCGKCCLE